jgi:hypothetical protein
MLSTPVTRFAQTAEAICAASWATKQRIEQLADKTN